MEWDAHGPFRKCKQHSHLLRADSGEAPYPDTR